MWKADLAGIRGKTKHSKHTKDERDISKQLWRDVGPIRTRVARNRLDGTPLPGPATRDQKPRASAQPVCAFADPIGVGHRRPARDARTPQSGFPRRLYPAVAVDSAVDRAYNRLNASAYLRPEFEALMRVKTAVLLTSCLLACPLPGFRRSCISSGIGEAPQTLEEPKGTGAFRTSVLPFLAKHCTSCHGGAKPKGNLDLAAIQDEGVARSRRKTWERVREYVEGGLMPPDERPQPSRDEIGGLTRWIKSGSSPRSAAGRSTRAA